MTKAPNEIDAQTFFEASQINSDSFVQGAELQRIFWRFKALEKELTRQKAFWKSTNDTLSQAFLQTQAQEQKLQETNLLLSQSYDQLQLLTNRLQHELILARQI